MTMRVLKAIDEREGFSVVGTSTDGDLTVTLDSPGAYRAEVRMMPEHVREDLRADAPIVLDGAALDGRDFVWIYTGAFYVE